MTYNYGDKITLDKLGEFVVFDNCIYDNKEYMMLIKSDQSKMLMVEVKSEDDLEILDDKEYIQKIINTMIH